MKIRKITTHTLIAFALASVATLQAGTLGPSCGSCYGSTYSLDNLGMASSTGLTETWRIKYTIDTKGYDYSNTDYIQSVALKVGSLPVTASLESTTAPGSWSLKYGGLSNNNCTGSGYGWYCAEDGTSAKANGSTYSWTFLVTLVKGTLLDGTNEAAIKANYESSTKKNTGRVVSESLTLGAPIGGEVPEPAALSLLIGGVGVWLWSRRRSASSQN
jgi:hypothetical protein